MLTWEITTSATFLNELLNVPHNVSKRVTKQIEVLKRDPIQADGDAKKLKGQQNTYRVRIGDYRLIYKFGQGWIKLLTIRKRNERTYEIELPETDLPVALSEIERQKLQEDQEETTTIESYYVDTTSSLPFELTQPLLQQWQIPSEYWEMLITVPSGEAILELAIPEKIMNRVIDNIYPRNLAEIAAQPDYIIKNPDDLERFFEGDLSAFLLKLDPEQERLLNFREGKAVLVKGGAGTGKSTLALYRVEKLIIQGYTSILFTTYTNALVNYSQQLLTQLLGNQPEALGVEVATVDAIARRYYV